MRIDVEKVLFIGIEKHKKAFFAACQRAGVVEFIDKDRHALQKAPKEVQETVRAYKVLQPLVPSLSTMDVACSAEEAVEETLKTADEIEKLEEKLRYLNLEIARIEPFGDFSREDRDFIEKEGICCLQFYITKKKESIEELKGEHKLVFLNHENGMDYYLAVHKDKTSYPGFSEVLIPHPLNELRREEKELLEQLEHRREHLNELAHLKERVKEQSIHKLNEANLNTAENFVQLELGGKVFAVEGWVSKKDYEELEKISSSYAIKIEKVQIEEKDKQPTCLSNRGFARMGQDLVGIYDSPSVADKDPSMWVLWAFAIFFAMIIGDAGYGSVYLLLALFLRWKFPKVVGGGRRVIKLFGLLGVCCIAWGVLTTSFFGMDIGINSPFRDASLVKWMVEKKITYHFSLQDDVYEYWIQKIPALKGLQNPAEIIAKAKLVHDGKLSYALFDKFSDNIMMEFSLFFGTIHVMLGLLRYIRRSIAGLGWIFFLFGAYLFFPSVMEASTFMNFIFDIPKDFATHYGLYMLYAGLILACLLSLIQNRASGAAEITNVIQIFADVLSYLRLYALGLAGGIMSSTFNDMGLSAGLTIGWLIILLGHTVNISLSAMSGVIHGLRLNFLEWYHYSFEGGGKMFRPLSILKIR